VTFLDEVLAAKEREIAVLRAAPPPPTLDPRPRSGFREALRVPGLSVIAEIKRRSPSKGLLAPDLDARKTAHAYAAGGASAISCLTDRSFFGANPDDLCLARTATLPVLRKDFIIDEIQIDESALMGASAVLLIVRILIPARLEALLEHAAARGLDALVEVHDAAEIESALRAGASIIGVNNRDLATLRVDPGRALALRARIPDGVVSVAESGVKMRDDVRKVQDAGFNAVLIGEALARSPDPVARLLELRGVSKEGPR
jgi:indole-3-glycerol phosphate synthase